jgi:V8-like Glu-specific endopeptidase
MPRTMHALAGLAILLAGARLNAAPANDDFANRILLSGASGQATGTNAAATRQSGEPDHAGNRAVRSVWWKWVAPSDGTATFDTAGSTFDTIISISIGQSLTGLESLVENDAGALGSECVAIFPVTAGEEHAICVDGFEGETGTIVLNWRTDSPCPLPSSAGSPYPSDGEGSVAISIDLAWGAGEGGGGELTPKKIYGTDNRYDIYQVTDKEIVKLWESTVAVVERSSLRDNGDGTYSLPSAALSSMGICPSERFASQPAPAFCSGFLVAPGIIATAGHCVTDSSECADTAFLFGFRMLDASTPVLTFPEDQVYFCDGIIDRYSPDDMADWGLIRLDREVPDHDPLPIRRMGTMDVGQDVFMIGHPLGLPAKYADGAWVRESSAVDYVITNLDAFGGNSGSAVFNADTHIVEGILVAGDPVDMVQSGNCWISSYCPDSQCTGEEVTRTTQFAHLVPTIAGEVTYEVHLGPAGGLVLQGETQDTTWALEDLLPETTYSWKVVAKDECGETEGPTWTFTTGPSGSPAFRRGDAVPDGTLDIADAIASLHYLFAGGALECIEAADIDDNGVIEITDPIGLLEHLFLAGAAPPAPSTGCGSDPTPDGLGCSSYAACGSSG